MPAKPKADSVLFGVVERLLAATAVLGAALYVLMNALYIDFYDGFGVRPEQVGLDRIAVLARSAWVALVVLALLIPVPYILSMRKYRQVNLEFWEELRQIRAAEEEERSMRKEEQQQQGLSGDDHEPATDERASDVRAVDWELQRRIALDERTRRVRRSLYLWMALLGLIVAVPTGFLSFGERIDREAEAVANGQTTDGIGVLIPFIDVRANRAVVTWVGEEGSEPQGLVSAPYMLYLGSGAGDAVFLACGKTTYIVQADHVAITLLDQGNARLEAEAEEAALDSACPHNGK